MQPTSLPSVQPSSIPTNQPSSAPSSYPSTQPSILPSAQPSVQPSVLPSAQPTSQPSKQPSSQPSMMPSIQPTMTPTVQPSGQPSIFPTLQPISYPTCIPSMQPTVVPSLQPISGPSTQPSSQPSSYPTVQPTTQPTTMPSPQPTRISSLSEWQGRLIQAIRNMTLDLNAANEQLLYYEMYHKYEPVEGGCSDWERYIGKQELTDFLNVQQILSISIKTTKLLHDSYMIVDSLPEVLSCTVPEIAHNIAQRVTEPHTVSDVYSTTCDGYVWRVSNCLGHDYFPAVCVGCSDPCVAHCSNARNLHYVSPCLSMVGNAQPTCLDEQNGYKRNGIINSINMLAIEATPKEAAPLITAYTFASINAHNTTVIITLSHSGGVECGVFKGNAGPPTSLDEVERGGYVAFTSNRASPMVSLDLLNLHATTQYSLYCKSFASSGAHMNLTQVQNQGRAAFTTLCCRQIALTLTSTVVYRTEPYMDLIKIISDSVADHDLMLTVSITSITTPSTTSSLASLLFPSVTIIPAMVSYLHTDKIHSTVYSTVSFQSPLASSSQYQISATIAGPSSADWVVVYTNDVTLFTVFEGGVKPDRPSLLSATLVSSGMGVQGGDGSHVMITFDSPTNMGGEQRNSLFSCSNVIEFIHSSLSQCKWNSSTHLIAYPFVNSTWQAYSGLNGYNTLSKIDHSTEVQVGHVVSLMNLVIQAQCNSYTVDCSSWEYALSQSVFITAPIIATPPVLCISAPRLTDTCSSPVLDLSSMTGTYGRRLRSLSVSITSPQATAASVTNIQSFFDSSYVLHPPTAIPSTLLEPLGEYTFVFTACNIMRHCSTATHKLAVLKNESVPLVSIIGSQQRYIYRNQALYLYSHATVTDYCGKPPSRVNLQYQWWLTKSDNIAIASLSSTSRDPSLFHLPVYAFPVTPTVTTYFIYLAVVDLLTNRSATTYISMSVLLPGIKARVNGASRRSIKAGGPALILDATSSFDLNVVNSTYNEDFTFDWMCLRTFPTLSSACPLTLTATGTSVADPYSVLAYSASTAETGTTSLLTLLVTHAPTNRTDTVHIYVSAVSSTLFNAVSSIEVANNPSTYTLYDNGYLLSIEDKIKLKATVLISDIDDSLLLAYTNLSAVWTADGGGVDLAMLALTPTYLDVLPFLMANTYTVGFNLVLQEGALSRGGSFSLTLSLGSFTTSTMIYIKVPPTPGGVHCNPKVGIELSTFFLLYAYQWQSTDLPLSYEFGYMDQHDDAVPLHRRSEISYASVILACMATPYTPYRSIQDSSTGSNNLCPVVLYVAVYDASDASAMQTVRASVAKNSSLTGSPVALLSFVESQLLGAHGRGSSDHTILRQIVASVSAVLNALDCSNALGNCSLVYYRKECGAGVEGGSTTSHTCGPCLDDDAMYLYQGLTGDSNSLCKRRKRIVRSVRRLSAPSSLSSSFTSQSPYSPYSSYSPYSLHKNITVESLTNSATTQTQHSTQSTIPTLSVSTPTTTMRCASHEDCIGLYEECIYGNCTLPTKQCNDLTCSRQGSCLFFNKNTGDNASSLQCVLNDAYCEAKCVCGIGYYGAFCQLSYSDYISRVTIRTLLIHSFGRVTSIDEYSRDSLRCWIMTLTKLSSDYSEVDTLLAVAEIHAIVDLILYVGSITEAAYGNLKGVLMPINSLLEIQGSGSGNEIGGELMEIRNAISR